MGRRGKIWAHVPMRYYYDNRYLDLSCSAGLGFHRLLMACDRWGRGFAGKWDIPGTMKMSAAVAVAALDELVQAGLVETFTSTDERLCFQVIDYDSAAPDTMIRKRGLTLFERPDESAAHPTKKDHNPDNMGGPSVTGEQHGPPIGPIQRNMDRPSDRTEQHGPPILLTRGDRRQETGPKGPREETEDTGLKDQSSQSRPGDEKPGERDAAIDGFIAIYELKLSRMELREPGRRGAGFFGPNSVTEVVEQLQHIWDVAPRTGRHVCARLWEHMEKSPEGFRGIEREINEFAIMNGMPTNAAIILRQMAEDERKAR